MITVNSPAPSTSLVTRPIEGRPGPARDPADCAGAAARRLRARRDDVVEEILAVLARTDPGRGRPAPQASLAAAVRANVDAVLDAVAGGITAPEVPIPAAAVACAARSASSAGSGAALLRAYLLGERAVLRRLRRALRDVPLPPRQREAADDVVRDRVGVYVDRVCTAVLDAQRAAIGGRHRGVTAGEVSGILDDPQASAQHAGHVLDVPVDRWHVGVVAWPGAGDGPLPLPALVALLQDALHGAVLAVPADHRTAWLWVSWDDRPDLHLAELAARLRPVAPVRLAVGQPGHGIDGFRSSHRQAQSAHRVAAAGPADSPPVVPYRAVALTALLRAQPGELDDWTRLVLGDLLGDDPPTARLRETARVYLQTGGSRTGTAARLGIHRNTVRNRIAQAERVLGRPLSEDRLDTEVALLVCDQTRPAGVTAGTPSG